MRRERFRRAARLGRLAARRAGHYGLVRVRAVRSDAERRAALDHAFALRSAEDVVAELGEMKGAAMKAGQMLGYVADGLPEPAQQVLASLQADVSPMAPSLAAAVVEGELGAPPEALFLDWSDEPVAAASIGQVHRAVTRSGHEVAVKVQYPGIDRSLESDLANADVLLGMAGSFVLKSLDTTAFVDELRTRMLDELDYTIEAANQHRFAEWFDGHPFVRIPAVFEELSTRRVLTTEWDHGLRFADFRRRAPEAERQRAAEAVFRFVQACIYQVGAFNGDPHPGNFLFGPDGTVTFIDFGLVKAWAPGELEALEPLIDPLLARDVDGVVEHMVVAGFIGEDHGLDRERIWDYVSKPYVPYLTPSFRFTPGFARQALSGLLDVGGPYADVMNELTMPASFVILDRLLWGVISLLGKLEAESTWAAILDEYRHGAPPATELGRAELAWRGGPVDRRVSARRG